MPSNHLILCRPLLPPSIFPSIRVFSNESALHITWPKYWSFSFSINPSNEYSGLISFRMDWLDLLAVQETLRSLLQHHSSKASILGTQLSLYMSHHLGINRQHLLPALGPWLCYQAAGHFLLLLVHHCAHSEAHQRQRGPWSAGISISDPSSAEPLKTYFGDGRNEMVLNLIWEIFVLTLSALDPIRWSGVPADRFHLSPRTYSPSLKCQPFIVDPSPK